MSVHSLVFSSPSDGVLVAPRHCGLLAVPDFLRQVNSWCESAGSGRLVVDLSQVETFEAGPAKALAWARQHCSAQGMELVVVPPMKGVAPTPDPVEQQLAG